MVFIKRGGWSIIVVVAMAAVVSIIPARWISLDGVHASFVQTGVPTQLATGTLSSAQILALNSATGLTLLNPSGAGTIIFVDSFVLESSSSGSAYSAGSNLELRYASGLLASNQLASTVLNSTPNFSSQTAVNLAPQPPAQFTNQAVQLILIGSSFTGGTATVNYTIQYHVVGGF